MLLANECVAKILADAEVPAAFRVHERPSAEDLRRTILPLDEMGLLEEGDAAALLAGDPFAISRVLERSREYPNRGESRYVRVYLDCDLPKEVSRHD